VTSQGVIDTEASFFPRKRYFSSWKQRPCTFVEATALYAHVMWSSYLSFWARLKQTCVKRNFSNTYRTWASFSAVNHWIFNAYVVLYSIFVPCEWVCVPLTSYISPQVGNPRMELRRASLEHSVPFQSHYKTQVGINWWFSEPDGNHERVSGSSLCLHDPFHCS